MARAMAGSIAGGAVAVLALVVALGGFGGVGIAARQEDPDATATRAAELAELDGLRTQVAGLSTEVARLSGEATTLAGRLGGDRAGFDAAYGAPTSFVGDDQVGYETESFGRLTVTFADGIARRLVASPDRPVDKAGSEADPADWTTDEAREIAAGLAPEDAELDEEQPNEDGDQVTATGSSAALAGVAATATEFGCPATLATFSATFTMPTAETVSAITLESTSETLLASADPAAEGDDGDEESNASGGGGAVANSSLGGTVTVNGVQVQALSVRRDAEGETAPAAGSSYLAVEVTIGNGSDGTLGYEPTHFLLVDDGGQELAAVCGGVEPAITGGELAAGDETEGWVSFAVPAGFEPERFVYLVEGSTRTRVGFGLE